MDNQNNGHADIAKRGRRARKRLQLQLDRQFTPQFIADADSRIRVVRLIRKRVELLKQHAGADSYQKDILCQRAVFVAILLETQEVEAAEGKPFELGSYVQGVNCLQGLLKLLGLERKMKKAGGLKAYLEEREAAA